MLSWTDAETDQTVDVIGCEIDSDKDGIISEKDLCPDTVANNLVDNTGYNLAASELNGKNIWSYL